MKNILPQDDKAASPANPLRATLIKTAEWGSLLLILCGIATATTVALTTDVFSPHSSSSEDTNELTIPNILFLTGVTTFVIGFFTSIILLSCCDDNQSKETSEDSAESQSLLGNNRYATFNQVPVDTRQNAISLSTNTTPTLPASSDEKSDSEIDLLPGPVASVQ